MDRSGELLTLQMAKTVEFLVAARCTGWPVCFRKTAPADIILVIGVIHMPTDKTSGNVREI